MPEILTERLSLERPAEKHFEGWAAMCADPETMRWIGHENGLSRPEAWRELAAMRGHWELRGYGMFAVVERASSACVGRVGPWMPEGWPDLEVGWTIARPYWGKGYATEAARASVRYAFDELDAEYVVHLIADDNERSAAVAERIGARLDGRARIPQGYDLRKFRSDR